jgi:hypothetical protein
MRWHPPLPSLSLLRAALTALALMALCALGSQARGVSEEPHRPAVEESARRLAIQQLRILRLTSLHHPDRAIPPLVELGRGALDDDLRLRAQELLMDSVTRAPLDEAEGLDAALRWVWVSSPDPQLRQRALLLLLARQLEDLPSGTQGAFLAAILPQVLRSSRQHQLPPSVALAQAVLESGWGRSRLAREHHNLFGVKAWSAEDGVAMSTREHRDGRDQRVLARFRAFAGVEESIEHHAELLAEDRRYAEARARWSDWQGFLDHLAPRYATDPAYAMRVSQIVERYDLDRWDSLTRCAAVHDAGAEG